MLSKNEVMQVMNKMEKDPKYFSSEAHLQMSFILTASKLFGKKYDYYPEYLYGKINNFSDDNAELDVLIRDTKTKEDTVIEFKYKTENTTGNKPRDSFISQSGVSIELKHQGAEKLGMYDCWHDISRIEHLIVNADNNIKNGFFIFITNDKKYWEQPKDQKAGKVAMDKDLDMSEGKHDKSSTKGWNDSFWNNDQERKAKSVSKRRFDDIKITNNYVFVYDIFGVVDKTKNYGTFKSLIVEI